MIETLSSNTPYYEEHYMYLLAPLMHTKLDFQLDNEPSYKGITLHEKFEFYIL